MSRADDLIAHLQLRPHPKEGGFFRETYRAAESINATHLPNHYQGDRSASTAIYYLLTPTTFSELHRLATDEVFHFYAGTLVRMLQLFPDGQGREVVIGPDVLAGQQPQVIVPRGVWQGCLLEPGGDFALLGCTVAPGFEFADYEAGVRAALVGDYPQHRDLIERLTH